MTMLDGVMQRAGETGMARNVRHKPTVEEYIQGYFDTDDVGYGLRMLISQFECRKQKLPFKVGDRVRMKRKYWHLGDSDNGWSGYAPMFADAIGTVTEVTWSVRWECWYLLVEYADPYTYHVWGHTRDGGHFNVHERSASFMFSLNYVKKAK